MTDMAGYFEAELSKAKQRIAELEQELTDCEQECQELQLALSAADEAAEQRAIEMREGF